MEFTPYLDNQTKKYYIERLNNPKVRLFFSKFPIMKGNVKTRLVGAPLSGDQLDEYLNFMEEYLRKKIWKTLINIRKPYTKERVNELLQIIVQADVLSVKEDTYQFASLLSDWAKFMVKTISEDAEKEFRRFPSSDNFFKWKGTMKMLDAVGCNEASWPESFAPQFILLNRKPYSVVLGDTLSKLALKYYGHKNLWDIIYLQNKLNYHPDRIVPGQKLILP